MAEAPQTSPPPPPPSAERSSGLSRAEEAFERFLAVSRVMILAPVVVLILSAAWAFVYGVVVFADSLPKVVEKPTPVGNKIGVFLIEIDLFLVGATLIIAAFGFYELFISKIDPRQRRVQLPRWLEMRDLNDLKARVISMLILVASVTFVDVELDFHDSLDTLYLGVAVAVVIGALTLFIRFGSQDRGPGP